MYKLGTIPSNYSNCSELADFLEYKCIDNGGVYSIYSAKSAISNESDELNNEGIESDDDKIIRNLQDALREIEERKFRSNSKYPFITTSNSIKLNDCSEYYKDVYTYLLLATRHTMGANRIMNAIDGTLVFEELSEIIAKSYFGANSKSMIFGTSNIDEIRFEDKVNKLLRELNEGGQFKTPVGSTNRQNDGKLDIVVWKPFSDKKGGKLVGFGQCKTGTSWDSTLNQLQPSNFYHCYTTAHPYLDPVRLFFIADTSHEKWEENCRAAGLLFDRCRLMDYLPESLPNDLITKMKSWSQAVINNYNN